VLELVLYYLGPTSTGLLVGWLVGWLNTTGPQLKLKLFSRRSADVLRRKWLVPQVDEAVNAN
jgi:hypothetical protein